MKKVNVYGVGYIGLPTSVILAESGYEVQGIDIKEEVINKINKGISHIVEKDLDARLKSVVDSNRFKAQLTPTPADVHLIAVPTPINKDKTPNIDYVLNAAESISSVLKDNDLIIIESTSPIGITEKVVQRLSKLTNGKKFFCAYCPERILPGQMLFELENNNRVVGGICPLSTEKAASFYQAFVKGRIHKTTATIAELSKLTENAFRDVNIAFANELSLLCNSLKVETSQLISIVNDHPRVNVLDPGVGVGGHCIAIDPWFLISDYPNYTNLIATARKTNIDKTEWVKQDILSKTNTHDKILLLGISYKPNVDDLRESPALEIAEFIKSNRTFCEIHDPFFEKYSAKNQKIVDTSNFDKIIILVNHEVFNSYDFSKSTCIDYTGKIL